MNNIIRVRNLQKCYEGNDILNGINLEVDKGEFVAIMGQSGSGKSTLLKILGLTEKFTVGNIEFNSKDITSYREDDLAEIRNKMIGSVLQDVYFIDTLSIKENIMIPLILDNIGKKEIEDRIEFCIRQVEIEKLLDKMPRELSDEEKRMAAICRALVCNPDILIADSPTDCVSSARKAKVVELFDKLNKENRKTIIISTGDPKLASLCDRVIFMNKGKIMEVISAKVDREDFYYEILSRVVRMQFGEWKPRTKKSERFIGNESKRKRLLYKDIIYISKVKGTKYVQYVTKEECVKELISIEQLEQELDQEIFVLVSRGILVNIEHIESIEGNEIILSNKDKVNVSRNRLIEVKERIKLIFRK